MESPAQSSSSDVLTLHRRALLALNDMNIALHEARSLDELLHVLVVKAFEGLGFDRGLIYMVEGEYLRVAAAIDLIRMEHGGVIRRRIGYDMTRENSVEIEALRTRRLIHVRDARRDPRVSPKFRYATSNTPEYCAVPILGRTEPIGVLTIDKFYSREPIRDTEEFFLEIFARQIGVAIESLRWSRELETLVEEKSREVLRLQMFLETVFRNLPAAIVTMDAQGRITAANPAARTLLDLPEITGPRSVSSLPEPGRARASPILDLLEQCLQGRPVRERSVRLPGSPLRLLSVSTAPLQGGGGDPVGAVAIGADVTEKVKIDETLQRMDRLSALGTLAAGVAHEIRNPLAGVSGLVQILQGRLEDVDPRGRLVEKIIEEIGRLNHIVRDLLQFSRQGRSGLEVFDPAGLIDRVLLLCRRELESRKIWVRREVPPAVPPIRGEIPRIQQALLNLVLNAAHAMRGGGELTLSVQPVPVSPEDLEGLWRWIREGEVSDGAPRAVVLSVRDTGEGMPEEVLNRVFHPFFTTKRDGTGLGLYIVHRIVEEHSGVVLAESQVGQGSVFHLVLPVAERDGGVP
ncbi:MAG: GAF domain-containing protein [Deltaproteobacteria bacterium]|nr:GAF domain-containing protein [Deltaproteobacteria bacterium]